MGWGFTITADQTAPLMQKVLALEEDAWQLDPEDPSVAYAEVSYQPVGWPRPYRYLVRRKREKEIRRKRGKERGGQPTLFDLFSYQIVVTNREGEGKALLKIHDQKGTTEKRIEQFTNEFLIHLPMGEFMANWVYLLCAQLGYNLSLWIRDLVLPKSYRKRYIKRIRRCVGLIAAKVVQGGRKIRLKVSVLHRWWKDFAHAWQEIPALSVAIDSG
ncbi:MAG: transposase [Candidatus Methylomirabilales bacterium]